MGQSCLLCREPIDPDDRNTLRRVAGWEQKASGSSSRRAGSDIVLRAPTGELAHQSCVSLARRGIDPDQRSLL